MKADAENSLCRDEFQQLEDELAEEMSEVVASRDSVLSDRVFEGPSGLEYDFSQVPFPELGGGPGVFWAGAVANVDGSYPGFPDVGGTRSVPLDSFPGV